LKNNLKPILQKYYRGNSFPNAFCFIFIVYANEDEEFQTAKYNIVEANGTSAKIVEIGTITILICSWFNYFIEY
jgi:hypothetical protein